MGERIAISDRRSPFADHRPEHLSRGPRLTARLPDVFEAKLVFSTEECLPRGLPTAGLAGGDGERSSEPSDRRSPIADRRYALWL
jgi:hypothetical protein